jgi:hypothetical protein
VNSVGGVCNGKVPMIGILTRRSASWHFELRDDWDGGTSIVSTGA